METINAVNNVLNSLLSSLRADIEAYKQISKAKTEYLNKLPIWNEQSRTEKISSLTSEISTARDFIEEERRKAELIISCLATSTLPTLKLLEEMVEREITSFQKGSIEFYKKDKALCSSKVNGRPDETGKAHVKEAVTAERARNYQKWKEKINRSLDLADVTIKRTLNEIRQEGRRLAQFMDDGEAYVDILDEIELEDNENFQKRLSNEIGVPSGLEIQVKFRRWGGWQDGVLRVSGDNFIITGESCISIGKGEVKGNKIKIKEEGWGIFQVLGFGVLEVEFLDVEKFSEFKNSVSA